ncbi:MAG TPA: AbrB/MazE/SpoVT family DNA-binding domain-containing protein [Chloroflexia bacterium]|nr:AbrB/MazE/SpoVT family DNA-binding domain-containing protein [Chloroflexia bacterium]
MRGTRTSIIRIGNSQGIRIPRRLLAQAGITPDAQGRFVGQEIEMAVGAGSLILRPARHVRAGWEEQFARMAGHGDATLLYDASLTNTWDEQEWVWS